MKSSLPFTRFCLLMASLLLEGGCLLCFLKLIWMKIMEEVYSYNFENMVKYTHISKAKLPYEFKIFHWLVEKGAVLTRDNMVKRKWSGDPSCSFCHELETTNHLFFQWGCALGQLTFLRICLSIDLGCLPGC